MSYEISCPQCGKDMTVSIYYIPEDPSVGFDGDGEVTVEDAECECELTSKEQWDIIDDIMWENEVAKGEDMAEDRERDYYDY